MRRLTNGQAGALFLAAYICSIAVANWATNTFGLVWFFGLAVTAGTLFAGAALVLRDGVQVKLGKRYVIAAILAGAALSYVTSSAALAVASGIAFLTSELVDFGVFTPLRGKHLPTAVLVSSVVAAPIDTVLFLYLAGFGVTWSAVVGQFIVKTALAGIVAWRLSCSTSRAA